MSQTAEKIVGGPDRVSCLLATLSDRKLLLPITAVAEVINTVTMPEAGNDKTSLYGWINWWAERRPLLAREHASGGDRPQVTLESRMAVLNAVGDASGLGFYAILLQSLPTPVQVSAETMRDGKDKSTKLSLADVVIGDDAVTVPDLMAIETVASGFKKAKK